MRVPSVSVPDTSRPEPVGAVKQTLQVATLKKALEGQKQEAEQLLKALEPKGRVIDIVV